MDRRELLTGVLPATVLSVASIAWTQPGPAARQPVAKRPVALVYRGPSASPGCAESVAALLATAPQPFRPVYCGPHERVPITAQSLSKAAVYAQPGGGDLEPAWQEMRAHAPVIRDWVRHGGRYLGFCLGAYLAGRTPGFGLLPGDTDEYVGTAGACIHTTGDAVIPVTWRGRTRHLFFQDGPYFQLDPHARATVLARYTNHLPAALVARYGRGHVGVVGPHPEADRSWYDDAGLHNPDGIRFDLGYDLIQSTMRAR